jgi:hypothetical protein
MDIEFKLMEMGLSKLYSILEDGDGKTGMGMCGDSLDSEHGDRVDTGRPERGDAEVDRREHGPYRKYPDPLTREPDFGK